MGIPPFRRIGSPSAQAYAYGTDVGRGARFRRFLSFGKRGAAASSSPSSPAAFSAGAPPDVRPRSREPRVPGSAGQLTRRIAVARQWMKCRSAAGELSNRRTGPGRGARRRTGGEPDVDEEVRLRNKEKMAKIVDIIINSVRSSLKASGRQENQGGKMSREKPGAVDEPPRRRYDWDRFEQYMTSMNLTPEMKIILRNLPSHDRLMLMVQKMKVVDDVVCTNTALQQNSFHLSTRYATLTRNPCAPVPTFFAGQTSPDAFHAPRSGACAAHSSRAVAPCWPNKRQVGLHLPPNRPLPAVPSSGADRAPRPPGDCALCRVRGKQFGDHSHAAGGDRSAAVAKTVAPNGGAKSRAESEARQSEMEELRREVELLRLSIRQLQSNAQQHQQHDE